MTPLAQTVGKRVKQLRTQANLTQLEFSDRLTALGANINQSHVSQIKRGAAGVSVESLIAISAVLDTSLDYLCGISDQPKPNTNQQHLPQQLTRQESLHSLLSDLAALTPEQQEEFAHLVSVLYDGIIAKSVAR